MPLLPRKSKDNDVEVKSIEPNHGDSKIENPMENIEDKVDEDESSNVDELYILDNSINTVYSHQEISGYFESVSSGFPIYDNYVLDSVETAPFKPQVERFERKTLLEKYMSRDFDVEDDPNDNMQEMVDDDYIKEGSNLERVNSLEENIQQLDINGGVKEPEKNHNSINSNLNKKTDIIIDNVIYHNTIDKTNQNSNPNNNLNYKNNIKNQKIQFPNEENYKNESTNSNKFLHPNNQSQFSEKSDKQNYNNINKTFDEIHRKNFENIKKSQHEIFYNQHINSEANYPPPKRGRKINRNTNLIGYKNDWFFKENEEEELQGPYNRNKMITFFKEGKVHFKTLISVDRMNFYNLKTMINIRMPLFESPYSLMIYMGDRMETMIKKLTESENEIENKNKEIEILNKKIDSIMKKNQEENRKLVKIMKVKMEQKLREKIEEIQSRKSALLGENKCSNSESVTEESEKEENVKIISERFRKEQKEKENIDNKIKMDPELVLKEKLTKIKILREYYRKTGKKIGIENSKPLFKSLVYKNNENEMVKEIKSYLGKKSLRVSEKQIKDWAKNFYEGIEFELDALKAREKNKK